MAIDIRATVACSLGTLISANISDEYVQGTGLIRCTGSAELSGIYTPALGTEVTFTYTRGATTTTIPRKLRVLSSFADPFRRTTRVELGCLLTYLADKKPTINWDAFDDPANASLTPTDAAIITIPIHASSVMDECLTQLGITASSNPLTNKFSVAEFDFSAGYVSVLSDLLVSECYLGYLDASEVLQVVPLNVEGGTGPVVDKDRIIDLGPIGAGQLPGEAVTVAYSSLRLTNPTDNGQVPDTDTVTSTGRSYAIIAWSDPTTGEPQSQGYEILTTTSTTTTYRELTVEQRDEATGALSTSRVNVVARRVTTYTISSVAILGSFFSQCFAKGNIGGLYINFPESTTTTETFEYDARGEEVRRESATYGSMPHASGQVGLPLVFDDGTRVNVQAPGKYLLDREVVETIRNGDKTRTITKVYGPWIKTIAGQQAIAEARDAFTTASQVQGYLNAAISGDFLVSTTIEDTETTYKGQRAPSSAERTNAANADRSGDPNNGYRTNSEARLELAVGSAAAQRRIELTLPYAPDDTFIKVGSTYSAVASDAAAKARAYGRTQNRLLLGNRSGMSIQTAAGVLPTAPFAPFVVQANGLSALYRMNGMGWTMSAEGVVVSTDALFWGAVGGTGDFWFPVAPGITTLPTTPAVVDGAMTVSNVVPVWNETVAMQGRLRLRASVEAVPYALTLPEVTVTARVRILSAVSTPPALTASIAAPVLGSSPATTYTGWTLLQDASVDDAFVDLGTTSFPLTLNSTNYTTFFAGSNGYITFGAGSSLYTGIGATTPALPKILFDGGDRSYQRVYAKLSATSARFRWEGTSTTSGTPGSSTRVVEVTLYPVNAGTQYIDIRTGVWAGAGTLMLATASTSLASSTLAANKSWVLEGNATGTTWTVHTDSHIAGG